LSVLAASLANPDNNMTDINTITTQFENKTLPKEQWTHRANFAVAFVYPDNYKTIRQIITQIMKVARDLAGTKYLTEGVKVVINPGKFQDTPHVHFHVAQGKEIR
jgi:hypothetical protein